jgi:6-pyruvoyltetrahydropterin/6-carboxytetrahydropterin synthase
MFELSKRFNFDAAHTLQTQIETASSRRIHGHTYGAEVTIRGHADPLTGMVMDVGMLAAAVDVARCDLDHHFLDDIENLGPATLENLSIWIWRRLAPTIPGLWRVTVYRQSSSDSCAYFGPGES